MFLQNSCYGTDLAFAKNMYEAGSVSASLMERYSDLKQVTGGILISLRLFYFCGMNYYLRFVSMGLSSP